LTENLFFSVKNSKSEARAVFKASAANTTRSAFSQAVRRNLAPNNGKNKNAPMTKT
jgi:hypothetical protein